MKRFTLKRIVEIVITILTAIVTTLGTQSCMNNWNA
ncbi:MAG: smalltalk protein [Prevotella sp.]|nr:smalltalk protein [Prevotella sp.]